MRNLQGLVSFVESAASGSFTAAAAKLALTPAAVGKNVMKLEQELGVRLFNRSTRRMQLTSEGSAFLLEASDALARLEQAVDNVTGQSVQPRGRVRLSCAISFGRRFVVPLLPELARHYPELQVELSLDNRVVDLLRDGYDIAIGGGVGADSSLVGREICALHSVLVAAPSYLRKAGVPRRPQDLAHHRVMGIRLDSGEVVPWQFRAAGRRGPEAWTPAAFAWTSDPESFLDLAVAGEGICQAGLLHAAPLLRAGRLRLVMADQYAPGQRRMLMFYAHRKFLSKRVRVVVEALVASFASEPDLHLRPDRLPLEWNA